MEIWDGEAAALKPQLDPSPLGWKPLANASRQPFLVHESVYCAVGFLALLELSKAKDGFMRS